MKKVLLFILTAVLLLSLASCSQYKSSYKATMLTRSSGGDSCEAEFVTLEGTLVLNAKARDRYADGKIHYEAELREGEITVYYDVDGTKELLFEIKGGERLDNAGGSVQPGDKVTIIIETRGVAKGGDIEIDFD